MAEFTLTLGDVSVEIDADDIVYKMNYNDDFLLEMFEELAGALISDSKRENFSNTLTDEWELDDLSNLRLGLLKLASDIDNYIKGEELD